MIGPTISWNSYGTLALAFIWMTRILTAHSKSHTPATEIDKHYPPQLSSNHGDLSRTVCLGGSPPIRSALKTLWTLLCHNKHIYPYGFTLFCLDLQARISSPRYRRHTPCLPDW